MDPVAKNTIQHFTHRQHPLRKLEAEKSRYLCDGCKTMGHCKRYGCSKGCYFNLHDYCATCPTTLSTFMHKHSLTLAVQKAEFKGLIKHVCEVCLDPIEGMFYRCNDCDFDLHTLCTQLPQKIHHALHASHRLELRTSLFGSCSVCHCKCTSWRYGCVTCGFDIHLECVLAPPPPSSSAPRTRTSVQPPLHPSPPSTSSNHEHQVSSSSRSQLPPPPHYGGGGGYEYPPYGVTVPYYRYSNLYNNQYPPRVSGGGTHNGEIGKKMFGGIGKKMIGRLGQFAVEEVVTNVIFGSEGVDFSSFM